MLQFFIIVLIVGLSLALLYRSKLPIPGPKGLPFVGYGPFVGKIPFLTFMTLSHKYGPIFKLQLGNQEWLILNSKEAIQEAFIKNGKFTSGRAHNKVMTAITGERSMSFTINQDVWKSQRMFVTKAFNSFDDERIEKVILQEAEFLQTELTKHVGKPCNCQRTIVRAVSNVACMITIGRRYDYHEKAFEEILASAEILSIGTDVAKRLTTMLGVNLLRFLPGYRGVFNYCVSAYDRARNEIATYIGEHKSTLVKDRTRDLMDEFLVEMSKRGDQDEVFTEAQIPTAMQTAIGPAINTTTNVIRWCIVGLTTHLEMQERIYKEVTAVLESRSFITMKEHLKMPFTRAYIQEVMRFCAPAPLLLPHRATDDFTLSGYKIPKGTPIFANIWSVHRSETLFENPDEFRPERFLDAEGKFVFCDELMAFSIGPRRCAGEQIGRLEVFLFVTGLVSRFLLLPDEDGPRMELGKGVAIIGFGPEAFKAKFIEREKVVK